MSNFVYAVFKPDVLFIKSLFFQNIPDWKHDVEISKTANACIASFRYDIAAMKFKSLSRYIIQCLKKTAKALD